MKSDKSLSIRAIRTYQSGIPLYAFFMPGSKVLDIADIRRLSRSKDGLDGFQRDSIQRHINGMVGYLNSENVLFPNAILLAITPRAVFKKSRGPDYRDLVGTGDAGILKLPALHGSQKFAWVVDGQQRSMALAKAEASDLPVPIIAFVSDDLQIHREQFILVNKARPLPRRLVDELLPEMDATQLQPDMAPRQIPSMLVNLLDRDPASPFAGLIRRASTDNDPSRVVLDAALLRSLKKQIESPLGALAMFRSLEGDTTDPSAMYQWIVKFWNEVKDAFPDAWGLPAEQSRLMHSAGITAMGNLMDFLMPGASQQAEPWVFFGETLRRIAPRCAWTHGRWPDMDCNWNEIESTAKDMRKLTEQLIRLTQSAHVRRVA